MNLPSLERLISGTGKVIARFPVSVFFALTGSVAATVNVELESLNSGVAGWCTRIIMVSNLGLVLSLSAALFSELRRLRPPGKLLLSALSALIPMLLLFLLNPYEHETDYLRFFMIAVSFHLMVAFVPFLQKTRLIQAFWQFNKTLFLRFLAGVLYSGVLYLGLAAVIGSMNFLFDFNFEWDTFAILWIWIAGMFNTIFVLSGIPRKPEEQEGEYSYPKGLKIFTQYVLIPLASVYVVILLAYELKVLLQWNMPKGLVSSLILGYAVFGILSLLLVYPIRNMEENKWIRSYSRSFYFLMLPLIVLLVLAVVARVRSYGITEERYFLIVLAAWLSFITGYFLLSKTQNIILIPLSLSLIILLGVYGPQSAFSVSRASQLGQLKDLLAENKALKDGKLEMLKVEVDSAGRERMRSIINYLVNKHGLESLQPLVKQDLGKVSDSLLARMKKGKRGENRYLQYQLKAAQRDWVYTTYAIPVSGNALKTGGTERRIVAETSALIPLDKADYLVQLSWYNPDTTAILIAGKHTLEYHFNENLLNVRLGKDSIQLDLNPMLDRLKLEVHKQKEQSKTGQAVVASENGSLIVPRSMLSKTFASGGYRITVMFDTFNFNEYSNRNVLKYASGELLLKSEAGL